MNLIRSSTYLKGAACEAQLGCRLVPISSVVTAPSLIERSRLNAPPGKLEWAMTDSPTAAPFSCG
jgi:hypothetical protein